jgi:TM2 domain-containing membrane protein YozV
MLDHLAITQGFTDQQRLLFMSEYNAVKKDRTVALMLTLFLGGVGLHHFYLGRIGLGVIYLLFFWTFIPVLISLVELFLIMPRTDRYNQEKAEEIAAKIRVYAPAPGAPAPATP